mmetsp:Transcript_82876/g.231134  ORF Transcript_82876/g.231134 Transcript_82876/m.231134 type:complete len:232 (-) Transcript_82876:685-1380(-)
MQRLAARTQKGPNRFSAISRCRIDGSALQERWWAPVAKTLGGLGVGLHRLHRRGAQRSGLCKPSRNALLHEAHRGRCSLASHGGAEYRHGRHERRKLVLPDLASLVPSLCLVGAHFRQPLQILLVVQECGCHGRALVAVRRDVLMLLRLQLLRLVQLKALLLDNVVLFLHLCVVRGHSLHLLRVNVRLLSTKVVKQALESFDDAIGMELVVLHRDPWLLEQRGELVSALAA